MSQIKLVIFTTLLSLFTFFSLKAQNYEWACGIGGLNTDVGASIMPDAFGNVYITGYFHGTVDFDPGPNIANFTSQGSSDIFILKLSPNGYLKWVKTIGGVNLDHGIALAVDDDGSLYATGAFRTTVDFDPGSGISNLISHGTDDIFFIKLDSTGNFLWAKSIGGNFTDYPNAIAIDNSGFIYITGTFSGVVDFNPGLGLNILNGASNDLFILKLDSAGNYQWAKSIGGGSLDQGFSIKTDMYYNTYFAGYFTDSADLNAGSGTNMFTSNGLEDILIEKLDSASNFIWAKAFGGKFDDRARSVTVDIEGNVYATGYFQDTVDFNPGTGLSTFISHGEQDIFIQKISASGSHLWTKTLGGPGPDVGFSITSDSTKNIYISGSFSDTVDLDPGTGVSNFVALASPDIFIEKLDSLGNLLWVYTLNGYADDYGPSISLDINNMIYLTGSFAGTVDFDPSPGVQNLFSQGLEDIFVLKLNQCHPISATISANGPTTFCAGGFVTLKAVTSPGQTYEWLRNGVPIFGANDSVLTVNSAGKYKAVVNISPFCSDTSNQVSVRVPCIPIGSNGEKTELHYEQQEDSPVLYPNPSTGVIKIDRPIHYLKVFNIYNQQINVLQKDESTFDLSGNPNGLYFVQLFVGDKIIIWKIYLNQ